MERRACCGRAVGCCCRTGDAERQNGKQALKHHRAVADLEHVLFVFHGFGRRAGGDQAVEAGDRAARHGDEQNREHRAERGVEARECRQVHCRVRNQKTDCRAGNHADEHECRHIVARLLEKPHRKNGCKEDVDKRDVAPGRLAVDERTVHADGKGSCDADQTDDGFLPARKVPLLLDQTEDDRKDHEHDRHHAGSTVRLCCLSQLRHAVGNGIGVERTCHHVGKRCDDNAAEQPAEQQEQLAPELADVLLNQHAHGLAFVLDRGIQGAEVRDRTEENAAQQHPQKHRHPAECRRLNGTGDRTRARDGRELVAENGPAVGRHIVLAVVFLNGRRLCLRVDAPLVCQPASVQHIGCKQNDCREQYDDECVHKSSFFHRNFCLSSGFCHEKSLRPSDGAPKRTNAKTKA